MAVLQLILYIRIKGGDRRVMRNQLVVVKGVERKQSRKISGIGYKVTQGDKYLFNMGEYRRVNN